MAWTYDPSLLSDTDLIHFLLGDTDESDQLISDDEIEALLAIEGSIYPAAARIAESLGISFNRKAQEVQDDTGARVRYGDRAAQFAKLATGFRGQTAQATVPMSSYARNRAVW